jgi:hypothetical protein
MGQNPGLGSIEHTTIVTYKMQPIIIHPRSNMESKHHPVILTVTTKNHRSRYRRLTYPVVTGNGMNPLIHGYANHVATSSFAFDSIQLPHADEECVPCLPRVHHILYSHNCFKELSLAHLLGQKNKRSENVYLDKVYLPVEREIGTIPCETKRRNEYLYDTTRYDTVRKDESLNHHVWNDHVVVVPVLACQQSSDSNVIIVLFQGGIVVYHSE